MTASDQRKAWLMSKDTVKAVAAREKERAKENEKREKAAAKKADAAK